MHPRHYASHAGDRIALIIPSTGESRSYAELECAANRGAHFLRSHGLRRGDVIAVLIENEAAIFDIAWAAQRIGLYLTSISTKLSANDVAYIVKDSGARLLIASDCLAPLAREALSTFDDVEGYVVGEASAGLKSWRDAVSTCSDMPVSGESPGTDMLYSSGTTGRPKGVKPSLPEGDLDQPTPLVAMGSNLYDMGAGTRYLSTSPLYHAAPLRWAMTVHRLGGTVVVMDRFDAERSLKLIEQYDITHATWVPTHFVRLLKLPAGVREKYDHRSLRAVIHAAAPCPVPIKQAMIDWWGPIVHEYYSGTEQCGITALSAREWLARPGSVGKAVLGILKIIGADGEEVPVGETGDVYFADGPGFAYHNDPEKTESAYNAKGWATLGDIGHVDSDGYLYLTDRRSFMIISGGVNIYPQEIENHIVTHSAVADVAVFGLPDAEMGERVVAVIQPASADIDEQSLTSELAAFARSGLGSIKTPKQFFFRTTLPREPTGKLMKARLIEEFKRDPDLANHHPAAA